MSEAKPSAIDASGRARYDTLEVKRRERLGRLGGGKKRQLTQGAAMVRMGYAVLAAAMGTPVAAEVLDATYRGTMVCDKLTVTSQQTREAIEVTISGGAVRYH